MSDEVRWFSSYQTTMTDWFESEDPRKKVEKEEEPHEIVIAWPAFKTYFEAGFQTKIGIVTNRNYVTTLRNAKLLILSGGEDIDPKRYGERKTFSLGVNPNRDSAEFGYFSTAIQNFSGIKFLAVCRGFQLINVALGGSLYQDLTFDAGKDHGYWHPLERAPKNTFASLFSHDGVNSLHHQGWAKVSRQLAPYITGEHLGIPEMVETERIVGTQFHPEFMYGESESAGDFFAAIKKWANIK